MLDIISCNYCPILFSSIMMALNRVTLIPSWQTCVAIMDTVTVCLVGERSEPGRSEPVLAAVWMEDEWVGLAPGGNIPPRCGLAPSSEKWRTEPTQLGSVPRASSSPFR